MNIRLSVASRAVLLFAALGGAAGLAACGQKGPLTLPEAGAAAKTATPQPAPAVAVPAAATAPASAASAP